MLPFDAPSLSKRFSNILTISALTTSSGRFSPLVENSLTGGVFAQFNTTRVQFVTTFPGDIKHRCLYIRCRLDRL